MRTLIWCFFYLAGAGVVVHGLQWCQAAQEELLHEQCACFSTCTVHDTAKFLALMPSIVKDVSSPWYPYLQAVYGKDVVLPFKLSTLRFFYHNSPWWRAQHADVDWPMPDCDSQQVPRWRWNSSCTQYCAKWYAEHPGNDSSSIPEKIHTRLHEVKTHYTGRHYPDDVVDANDSSIGTHFVTKHDDLTPRRFKDDDFVEVMRGYYPIEQHGIGTWFFMVPGTGIWMRVGRHYQPNKERRIRSIEFMLDQLTAERRKTNWTAGSSTTAQAAQSLEAKRNGQVRRLLEDVEKYYGTRNGEPADEYLYQILAGALNYTSAAPHLHPLRSDFDGAESQIQLAVLKVPSQECCQDCGVVQRARVCDTNEPNTCGHGIPLRWGWNAAHACSCNDKLGFLNCGSF
eukprot:gnl/TRDRNA2_/TRDRNA2_44714_c0_seq1.p1 gnl/TRDRNA2_/TRDRNA2_44714_c0~~gnl/TRDRNA2_/TRDRNA2_44714_c0_seq1.p1  ORF type:complete len:398 (+),score=24.12 gnl/TRDRNA2_/TRDRNA2_44714_c0_seq1:66-1259(+)